MAGTSLQRWTEYCSSGADLVHDANAPILRRVKILGNSSANGRDYPLPARRKAVGLYEGVKVNVDHPLRPGDPRPVVSRFGIFREVSVEANGTYANLHYNPKHPLAEMVRWWAENEPSAIGLSHNAEGRGQQRGQRFVVEEIVCVHSVDLVSDPATTGGLFEGRGFPMTKKIKAILEAAYTKPSQIKILREMGEEAMAGDMPAPAPESSPEEQAKAAFKAMVLAVLDDDSLDLNAKKSKIGEILKVQDKLMNGDSGDSSEPPADGSGDAPAEEGKKSKLDPALAQLREQLDALQREKRVRQLAAEGRVSLTEAQIAALSRIADEAQIKIVLAGFSSGSASPRSAGRGAAVNVQEQKNNPFAGVANVREAVKLCYQK